MHMSNPGVSSTRYLVYSRRRRPRPPRACTRSAPSGRSETLSNDRIWPASTSFRSNPGLPKAGPCPQAARLWAITPPTLLADSNRRDTLTCDLDHLDDETPPDPPPPPHPTTQSQEETSTKNDPPSRGAVGAGGRRLGVRRPRGAAGPRRQRRHARQRGPGVPAAAAGRRA